MTKWSNPASLNSGAKKFPTLESPRAPVKGDFAAISHLVAPRAGIVTRKPAPTRRTFSGPKGRVFGVT